MCGRFSLVTNPQGILEKVGARTTQKHTARLNISPGQDTLAILSEKPSSADAAHWGIEPKWKGPLLINAKAEGLEDKPTFSEAFFHRRCLIPADGFYEWKDKVPYWFTLAKGTPFFLAGIYEDTKPHASFTIITVPPNSLIKQYHERMPVILEAMEGKKWLTLGGKDVLQPFSEEMHVKKVDKLIPDS